MTARASRRGRGGRTSPRTLLLLLLVALGLFAGGLAVLYGRSEDGQIARARLGLPVNRPLLSRTLARTIRQDLVEFGIPPGAQVIQARDGRGGPPVRWTAYLPGRASPLQLHAKLAESLAARHAQVIDAWEDTLAAPGSEVHLVVGAGRTATHEIVLARRVDTPGAKRFEPARLLLVVDGFAYDGSDSLAREYLALDVPFSAAVLPHYRGTRDWANRLAEAGHEVLVQIPMEPLNYPQRDPGPGAVLVDMSSGEIQRVVKRQLSDVPHAVGATSYMGALALADGTAMEAVMTELKRANVFYLDARTVAGSQAAERAARAGVTCFRIDRRLEALGRFDVEVKALSQQLDSAVDLARRRGYAIVLAHHDPATLAVLKREIPKLKRSGVRFEPVSSLLEPQAF